MIGRIVEIESDDRHLSCDRGFLVVRSRGEELGRVPLDDVAALIGNAHGLTYSNNLLAALAERGAPFVLCGSNHKPVGVLLALEGHHLQGSRVDAQWLASLPLRKQLWKEIVQRKIGMQAAVLEHVGKTSAPLLSMIRKVKSGDPSNVEAQAARAYWKMLFGGSFRRDPDEPGRNAMLNYGYAIVRAIVARHVTAAGLHVGVPLHHANAGNSMRLVDDLMEPFRPLVDLAVAKLAMRGCVGVNREAKAVLGRLHARPLVLPPTSPLSVVVSRFVQSLVDSFDTRQPALLPLPRRGEALELFWSDHAAEDAQKAGEGSAVSSAA